MEREKKGNDRKEANRIEADKKENGQNEFIFEKIKERPISKGRLIRRTFITAVLAVLFGLVACFTFLLLEPVISNWLYPPEETPKVMFPEDKEEMSPEEMLIDTMLAEMQQQQEDKQEEASEETEAPEEVALKQEQIDEILESFVMDRTNYQELYTVMSGYVAELKRYMVTVTGYFSEVDWMNNEFESTNQSSGVIIASNEQGYYILADYAPIKDAKWTAVTFCDNVLAEAKVVQYDPETELAVVLVAGEILPEQTKETIQTAALGNSLSRNMAGMPVVALGSPMGIMDSVAYGMITSNSVSSSLVDANYKMLYTDIYGSSNAGGILFNMRNEVIGIITNDHSSSDLKNTIIAYGISGLKGLITRLSNSSGYQMPYLGISGADVKSSGNKTVEIPKGAYVMDVEMDSPAMKEGIRQGDIITSVGETVVANFNNYMSAVLSLEAGQEVELTVMRLSQEEYKEMKFTVTVDGVGLEE